MSTTAAPTFDVALFGEAMMLLVAEVGLRPPPAPAAPQEEK